jgi:UDP-N-acetylmuramate dehydrogenase
MEFRERVGLKDWTWWKIGGPADYFCLPNSIEEVREAILFSQAKRIPITVLGGGTNVLASDAGVEGLVICMKQLNQSIVREEGDRVSVEALAGTPKSELTKIYMKRKLAPALFLCGLPGDIGGGIVMNAGISEKVVPREFVEITDWFEYLDLSDKSLPLKRLEKSQAIWHYRHTEGWQPGIIVRAQVSWLNQPIDEIPNQVREATKNRLARQPLDLPSCGSTFKNPTGHHAGALIEKAGLKGFKVGGAQVSPKHANFIVNVGGATSADVEGVINNVKTEVKKQFGVTLEAEVRYIGRW